VEEGAVLARETMGCTGVETNYWGQNEEDEKTDGEGPGERRYD
jgi:hypothetical protein